MGVDLTSQKTQLRLEIFLLALLGKPVGIPFVIHHPHRRADRHRQEKGRQKEAECSLQPEREYCHNGIEQDHMNRQHYCKTSQQTGGICQVMTFVEEPWQKEIGIEIKWTCPKQICQ